MRKKETRTEYQGGITGHVGVLATIMILTGIYINIVTTEDWRNGDDVYRHTGAF